MSGAPLAKAKQAVRRALRSLGPEDTFQLVEFSDSASQLGASPVPATPENVARGLAYLESLNSQGGTMMIEGIKAALDFPHDPTRFRMVCFLTDGYIGNEAEIFREIEQRLGASRLFSFGIGTSVNRYLLDGMARMGHGEAAYISLDDSASAEIDRFYPRIRHPVWTELSVDWGGTEVKDVSPSRLPDLVLGRPVIVAGRFTGQAPTTVRVSGKSGGKPMEITLSADSTDAADSHPGLPYVWARSQIREMSLAAASSEDRSRVESLAGRIKSLALEYGLVSDFTAFVAVDATTRTAGAPSVAVRVPVPMPEGVLYKTTVLRRHRE
jgi:Ca-activated chloride channel family protein